MDAFQTSVGYRSIWPSNPPEQHALEQLAEEELLRFAKDSFDTSIAETLRSTGEWHWKLDTREIAEDLAEMLSPGQQLKYERLRDALLEYYEERYRKPSVQEYRAYLAEKQGKNCTMHSSPSSFQMSQEVLTHLSREAQDLPMKHYEARTSTPWYPGEVPWWNSPTTVEQRTLIAQYFIEWAQNVYPLQGVPEHGQRLGAQLEALLTQSIEDLTDLLYRMKKGDRVAERQLLLPLVHTVGAFISLIQLDTGNPDGLELVWNRLSELRYPVDALIATVASYYERLAALESPLKDGETLLLELFSGADHPGKLQAHAL